MGSRQCCMQPCSVHTGTSEQLTAIKKCKSGRCLQESIEISELPHTRRDWALLKFETLSLQCVWRGKRLQMYLFTVKRYVKRDLKVISVSSPRTKPEQGSFWALNWLHQGLFCFFSKGKRNSEIRFCSTQEETTANCLDSCSNLTEIGLDV